MKTVTAYSKFSFLKYLHYKLLIYQKALIVIYHHKTKIYVLCDYEFLSFITKKKKIAKILQNYLVAVNSPKDVQHKNLMYQSTRKLPLFYGSVGIRNSNYACLPAVKW